MLIHRERVLVKMIKLFSNQGCFSSYQCIFTPKYFCLRILTCHVLIVLFTYLFLTVLGLHCCVSFSLVVVSGGWLSSCGAWAPHWVVSVIAERGLEVCWLSNRGFWVLSAGSVVVARGLSCSAACGIFQDQGANWCPLHCKVDSEPLGHQGSPTCWLLLMCS